MRETKPFEISKKIVGDAYKQVKANKGAAGVDGESIIDFEKHLEDNLYKIWNRMSSGSYFPPPVRAVDIMKDKTRKRRLGIPTVSDRIAQTVTKMHLEPCVEPYFHPDSYGYRSDKSATQAVGNARERCWHNDWVLDLDIKGFFDNLDHEIMMDIVRKHTDCKWIILYIERWLKALMQLEDGTLCNRNKGTPQGGVISPLLANLYLHYAFDKWMQENYPTIPFERYADDILVHCKSEKQAKWIKAKIKERLAEYKLELHPQKTKIVYCKDGNRKGGSEHEKFTFLGFEFRARKAKSKYGEYFTSFLPAISKESIKEINRTIRDWNIQRYTNMTIEEIVRYINPIVSGWFNYYGSYYKSAIRSIQKRIDLKLAKWAVRKYKRMNSSLRRALMWVNRIKRNIPNLFAHGESEKRTMAGQ